MRESSQASKNLSHTLSDENAKRLAEDVSGSYEKGMQQRSDASKSFSEAENYQQQAMFTKANAASINRNANQEFFEWMANQPADNAPGKMGKQEAAYLMAQQPELTMEYARRFSNEKGFNQKGTNFEGYPQKLQSDYEKENRQSVYTPTENALNDVRNQGKGELSKEREPSSNVIRNNVESLQRNTKEKIDTEMSQIQEKGNATKDNLIQNQEKGVVRRLGAKGVKEVRNIAHDAKEAAEMVSSKIFGESQQG
jgi:conjugal transfer mating pair stabilization protein TraG